MVSLILGIIAGGIALLFATITAINVIRQPAGNQTIKDIAHAIQEGSFAFLKREYTYLLIFVVIIFAVLWVFVDADVLDKFNSTKIC